MSEAAWDSTILIGVDGGGTGTRIAVSRSGSASIRLAEGPASALSLGVANAWDVVAGLCAQALDTSIHAMPWSRCVMVAGMAGAHHLPWREQFLRDAPAMQRLRVETDAFTTLAGAHAGRPGAMIALGTGSVGEAMRADGNRVQVGGYGFPAGDEAGGAWIGLRASRHVQQAFDARVTCDAFAQALAARMPIDSRDALIAWLGRAQARDYARLAPTVFAFGTHPVATAILDEAVDQVRMMVDALDRHGDLPIALCGGVGAALRSRVSGSWVRRLVDPESDAAHGALVLAREMSRDERVRA
ncbi:BadF/BadG/BcrA/BcrD ATPase family protein [Pararobbsia silviterrae]|uniref:ATPase n=1 Tax=Pararobbsia silviterrae TaxID=1792498 RepID=A0A494XPV5_9BURK|nr:BadF/BadG/BcrA/BcrD ATPase family protein [Pararobbsia silviterrae]RKP51842.1 ATPase [Pararobbsia silviterrae]